MARNPRRHPLVWLWLLTLLLGASLVAWLFWPTGKSTGPWKPATVAYDPTCKKGCKKLKTTILKHLGKISVYVQPKVDDAIAQWGDCLDSVTQCVESKGLTAGDIGACVKASACPLACKSAYSVEAKNASKVDDALDAMERVFIREGAVCLPEEKRR